MDDHQPDTTARSNPSRDRQGAQDRTPGAKKLESGHVRLRRMATSRSTGDTIVYLGLGANLGDRLASLRSAVVALDQTPGIRVDWDYGIAPIYETAPVGGPPDQPHFLNTAIRIFTTLDPFQLLATTQHIEDQLGRTRTQRWAARTIDIDILLFGDRIIDSETLTIPHRRLHERRFALKPLSDIAGEMRHPGLGLAIQELDRGLEVTGPVERLDHLTDQFLLRHADCTTAGN